MAYGIGFNSGGIHKTKKDGKKTKIYDVWWSMMKRCGSEVYKLKHPAYKEVITCEEWKDFQNFAEWCIENYRIGFELDKDILCKDCKIYSPETCVFVPSEVNSLFVDDKANRGDCPVGVYKQHNKYRASISKNGVNIPLGLFKTKAEAFDVYKIEKEKWVKQVADKWKICLTDKVYLAMYSYTVNIND
jgi:hypothetical protein